MPAGKVHRRATRCQVMHAVAWALRYPPELPNGPAELALKHLEARRGTRLVTRFGRLYGRQDG